MREGRCDTMPMDMADMLKRLNGKFFDGDTKDGYAAGHGTYQFSNGTVYQGSHFEGMFDGEGTLSFPKGGKFVATWKMGKLVKGEYFYDDELEYMPEKWKYCTDADRRFWTEIQNGINLEDTPQLTDQEPPMWIPEAAYDVGDGYFDPRDGQAYNYEGQFMRVPSVEEAIWASHKCRIGDKGTTDELNLDDGVIEEEEDGEEGDFTQTEAESATEAEETDGGRRTKPGTATSYSGMSATEEEGSSATEDEGESSAQSYCAATMGGAHEFEMGVCVHCGLTPEFVRQLKSPGPGTVNILNLESGEDTTDMDAVQEEPTQRSYTPCPATMGGHCSFVNGVCNQCDASEKAPRPYSACPATMGARHSFKNGICLHCDRADVNPAPVVLPHNPGSSSLSVVKRPSTSCAATMGAPHSIVNGVCTLCGKSEQQTLVRPESACPATMGARHEVVNGACPHCGRSGGEASISSIKRPQSACASSLGQPHQFVEGACSECGRTS